MFAPRAGVTQLVECDLAKVDVAGSNPVSRSIFSFKIRSHLLLWMALPEMFAKSRDQRPNAVAKGIDAFAKVLVCRTGFIRKLLDSVYQALVCGPRFFGKVPYAQAQFSNLALRIAP